MMINNDGVEEDLATIKTNTKKAARKVVHRRKHKEKKAIMTIPENVRVKKLPQGLQKKKTRREYLESRQGKARAEHLVKRSLEPGKKKTKSKPDRTVRERAFYQRQRGMAQKNSNGIEKRCALTWRKQKMFRWKDLDISRRNQQFTEEGRHADITVERVLQAREKLGDNKVEGPEDAIVSEMIKWLPMKKIYTISKCLQERFMGQMESPTSRRLWKSSSCVRGLYIAPGQYSLFILWVRFGFNARRSRHNWSWSSEQRTGRRER